MLKKQNIRNYARPFGVLALCNALAFLLIVCSVNVIRGSAVQAPAPLAGQAYIIDPGHGGLDGGCSSPDGVHEREVTLAIALRLGAKLEAHGATVRYTRTDQASLVDENGKWDRNKDLRARAALMQANPEAIVISLHANTFPSMQEGIELFVEPRDTASMALAEHLQAAFREHLQPENKRAIKTADLYILRKAPGRAVLIECGFLNNPAEAARLVDPAWQELFVQALVSGLSNAHAPS